MPILVDLSQQQSPAGENVSLKHQLLQVIVRVAQYRMLLTGESCVKDELRKNIFYSQRLYSFFHSFHRLSEQPLPWFQGIWRHPRYLKHTAEPVWTELLTREPLCLLLCSQQTYLCSFGMERWPWGSQCSPLLLVVVTHQTVISALSCLKTAMWNSWEDPCQTQHLLSPIREPTQSRLVDTAGLLDSFWVLHLVTFYTETNNKETSQKLFIFMMKTDTSSHQVSFLIPPLCVWLKQLLWR